VIEPLQREVEPTIVIENGISRVDIQRSAVLVRKALERDVFTMKLTIDVGKGVHGARTLNANPRVAK
jgi:hypothetical protein